jgi:uncharacterized coiled-coil protein SlyX
MTAGEDYILYAFLAFMSLVLVTILGVLYRQSRDIGELKGQFNGLIGRMDRFESRMDRFESRMDRFESRMERFEQQLSTLGEQVAEIRGMMLSLHERMDLLMRHRHDDAGRVVITPEEVVAD